MIRINTNSNNFLKVLALILSILTWLAVRVFAGGGTTVSVAHRIYTVPISYTGVAQGMVYSAKENQVTVTLRGKLATLDNISPSLISAMVDLSERTKASNALETVNVMAPGGVDVASVDPAYVWVQISTRQTKNVPVSVNLQGQVESGYSVGDIDVVPKEVKITGGAEAIDSVIAVRAPLALTSATKTFSTILSGLIPIDSAGDKVEGVKIANVEVSATVPVRALVAVKVDLERINVKTTKGRQYSISVEPERVLLECASSSDAPLKLFTEARHIILGNDKKVITVPVRLPENVQLAPGISKDVVVSVMPLGKITQAAAARKKAAAAKGK